MLENDWGDEDWFSHFVEEGLEQLQNLVNSYYQFANYLEVHSDSNSSNGD